MTDCCEIPRCRDDGDLTYLGHAICSRHWNQLTNENAAPDALRVVLGIEAALEPTMEDTNMSKSKRNQTLQTPETPLADVTPEPEKKTKAPKASKAGKVLKKRERKPKEELCVFALRMRPEERDALHQMAGPANASRFARTILVAAASGDETTIRSTIKEAREARA